MNKVFKLLFSAALMLCCFAASAAGTQPSTGDGSQANPYQIATSDNLVWFAEHVNSGNASACAKLTADITVNTGVLDSNGDLNGTPSNTWTPIGGQNGRDYSGEFDGDGHTISGLYFNDESVNNIGLFGKAVGNAHIHDLGIKDSYFCGNSWVGGICGDFGGGRIENCWNGATVMSKGNNSCAGGIAGSCWTDASIAGCYNTGKISCTGSSYGGISGVVAKYSNVGASVKDCFTLNSACDVICNDLRDNPVITNSDAKDAAAFASGEVCWLLNNGVTDGSQKWYQTLNGTDNLPVLDDNHGTVYYGYDGNVLTYSNSQLMDPSNKASYIDANGEPQVADNVTEITNSSSTLSAGWYVVRGSDVKTGTLTCNGEVHLILADGAKLTASGGTSAAGITVSGEGNSLAIYGQTAQSGQLIASGGSWAAGIGGGENYSGSNITINGGVVKATGGRFAAGIGGGDDRSGSNITINGGEVTANGGDNGAGIGGGDRGEGYNIIINGGTVTANGGDDGAGIGGGWQGSGSYITINGGTVTANAGEEASCIGRGYLGNTCSNIFVAVGLVIRADNSNPPLTVVAHTTTTDIAGDLAPKRYATIRPLQDALVTYGDYITVCPEIASGDKATVGTEITFTAADRWAENYEFLGFYKESTFDTPITVGVSGRVYTTTVVDSDISVYAKYEPFTPIPYIDADGQPKSVKATEITNSSSTLSAGWYAVTGSDVQTGTLTCNGAVHLILADGAKLTATGGYVQAGITVSGGGNSLTIYGQTAQSGQLFAKGGNNGAGIGGGSDQSSSNITINGGIITATGGDCGAGIGGGDRGAGYNIIINRGVVTATGGNMASGIGGGFEQSGYDITINGGEVTANGGEDGAGIGGGIRGSGSNIRVAASLTVCADNTNPPTTEIHHTDNDIASHIAVFRYVTVKDVTTGIKDSAIAAINAAIEGVTNEDIIAIAENAINAINAATSADVINAIKEQALAAIASAKAIYASGLGEMGEPCEDCPSVEVTGQNDNMIKLYNPKSVTFKKE